MCVCEVQWCVCAVQWCVCNCISVLLLLLLLDDKARMTLLFLLC